MRSKCKDWTTVDGWKRFSRSPTEQPSSTARPSPFISLAVTADLKWSCDHASARPRAGAPVPTPSRRPARVVAQHWWPSLQPNKPPLPCLDWGARFFIFLPTCSGEVSATAAAGRDESQIIFFILFLLTCFSCKAPKWHSQQPTFLCRNTDCFLQKTPQKNTCVLVLTEQKTRNGFNGGKKQNEAWMTNYSLHLWQLRQTKRKRAAGIFCKNDFLPQRNLLLWVFL